MPHSQTYNSIILKAYDVGEADRFLILFTREKGRMTARARAVRKLKSKLGGTLLPFNHCTIDMVEGSKGYTVTSARRTTQINLSGTESFLKAEQGVELLLSLIHDEEPLENIFDLTLEFLIQCEKKSDNSVLPFTINLLHYLGLMPEIKDIPKENLQSICDNIIEEHGSSALKAKEVAKRII